MMVFGAAPGVYGKRVFSLHLTGRVTTKLPPQQVGKVAKSRKLTTRQLNKLLQAQRLIQKAADMLDDLPFDYPNDKEADMVHEDVSDADIEAALLDAIREATEKK